MQDKGIVVDLKEAPLACHYSLKRGIKGKTVTERLGETYNNEHEIIVMHSAFSLHLA